MNTIRSLINSQAHEKSQLSRSAKTQDFLSQYKQHYGEACIACGASINSAKLSFENIATDRLDSYVSVFACPHCGMGITYPILTSTQCAALYDDTYTQMPTGALGFDDQPRTKNDLFPVKGILSRINKRIYHDLVPSAFCRPDRWKFDIRPLLFSKLFAKFFIGWPYFTQPKTGQKGKFLDCGAGQGRFLALVPENSLYEFSGIDINPVAVSMCQNLGLNVKAAALTELCEDGFQFIRFWHVLEHTSNPTEYIQAAHARLESNGVLIIGIPNFDPWPYSITRRTCGMNQWMHLPYHRFHWTPKSITAMLSRHGYTIISIRTKTSGPFRTMSIAQHLRSKNSPVHITSTMDAILQILWFILDIPLDCVNGGETLEVYARRS